jgi:hypothetical protein
MERAAARIAPDTHVGAKQMPEITGCSGARGSAAAGALAVSGAGPCITSSGKADELGALQYSREESLTRQRHKTVVPCHRSFRLGFPRSGFKSHPETHAPGGMFQRVRRTALNVERFSTPTVNP